MRVTNAPRRRAGKRRPRLRSVVIPASDPPGRSSRARSERSSLSGRSAIGAQADAPAQTSGLPWGHEAARPAGAVRRRGARTRTRGRGTDRAVGGLERRPARRRGRRGARRDDAAAVAPPLSVRRPRLPVRRARARLAREPGRRVRRDELHAVRADARLLGRRRTARTPAGGRRRRDRSGGRRGHARDRRPRRCRAHRRRRAEPVHLVADRRRAAAGRLRACARERSARPSCRSAPTGSSASGSSARGPRSRPSAPGSPATCTT